MAQSNGGWRGSQSLILFISDVVVLTTAMVVASLLRFGVATEQVDRVAYTGIGALLVAMWLLLLASAGCYETRFLGTGTEEFKRVAAATFRAFAGVAIVSYAFQIVIVRGYVAIAMPLGFVLLLFARWVLRKELQHAAEPVARCTVWSWSATGLVWPS